MPESLLAGCTGWRLDCIDGELGPVVDLAAAPGVDEPSYLVVSRCGPSGAAIVSVHVSLVTQVDPARRRLRVGAFRACLAVHHAPGQALREATAPDGHEASGCGLDHRPRSV